MSTLLRVDDNVNRGRFPMHPWVGQQRSNDQLPRVSCGKGCDIFDDSGKRYLDGSGGPALFSLGYNQRNE